MKLDADKIIKFIKENLKQGKATLRTSLVNRHLIEQKYIQVTKGAHVFNIYYKDDAFVSLSVKSTSTQIQVPDWQVLIRVEREQLGDEQLALIDEYIKLFLLESDPLNVLQRDIDDIFSAYVK